MSPTPTPSRSAVFGVLLAALALAFPLVAQDGAAAWKPVSGRLMTRWATEVSPDRVHAEYPRPTMVRDRWQNLNGLWSYSVTPAEATSPGNEAGKILVPFPMESALSGVGRNLLA